MTSRWWLLCPPVLCALTVACTDPKDTRAVVDGGRRDTGGDLGGADRRDASPDAPAPAPTVDAPPAGEDLPQVEDAGVPIDADPCPGKTMCGASCVDLMTDPANCGMCGKACASVANGAGPSCEGGVCKVVCNPGFHLCTDKCVSNDSVETCGQSCGPACPGTPAAPAGCDGTKCTTVAACPDPAQHFCENAGGCKPKISVDSCGTRCTPCPKPANGTSTCDGTACGFTCNTGFHKCGATCAADSSATQCGPQCTACQPTAGLTAACLANVCRSVCPGAPTVVCPAPPANATASCTGAGNTCDFACQAGYHRCGSACVIDSSAAMCGPMCKTCPAPEPLAAGMPAFGVAACAAGACTAACEGARHACTIPAADASQLVLTCNLDTSLDSCGPSCALCPGWADTCAKDATTGKFRCSGVGGPVPSCEAGTLGCDHCRDECPAGWQVTCQRDDGDAFLVKRCCNPAKTPVCCDPTESDPAAAGFCTP